ncbi:hypothetical protein Y013_26490 (plasmid) [Rhodococcus pyridinivorans SB3094]|uniref:Cold-shock protein n=1 Tax=Rhodococcus pyridinivorans SB3094 TaxID=1435356 RepID=V9XQ85_9NOCA|nr:hypothetical protein [Rhodococcus pyridinivorans]AHD24219.1 hypothetical protein Y013_26490 [Rhodococcus pyridinivorans SB3094]
MTSEGVVAIWHGEEGWGVIESADTPTGCWVHFSNIWTLNHPPLARGESIEIRGQGSDLQVGETVDFEWERVPQDGYSFRAVNVRPRRQPPRRTVRFSINGERVPWPIDHFGELPHAGLWTE